MRRFSFEGTSTVAAHGKDGLYRTSEGQVFEMLENRGLFKWVLRYSPKYISFKNTLIELRYLDDGFWHSCDGTIFALADDSATLDPINRCGIGILSFNTDFPLTIDCRVHDYMYSSPAFQLFHTRSEADTWLQNLVIQTGEGHWYKILAKPFRFLANLFGGRAWENEKTR